MATDKLRLIVKVVCEELNLSEEVIRLPRPFHAYKDGRKIIARMCEDEKVDKRLLLPILGLKWINSIDNLLHSFRMTLHQHAEAVLNDRYKRCLAKYREIGKEVSV